MTTTNFKSIPLLRQWCMLTLPTVFNDALSYNEQVCKLTQAINEMATTINGLPDYIIELVKELLDQMNLEEIVKQVLADYFFINVKNPPALLVAAKGDGIANDTAAIQAMINYVSGKKNYLFFPAGIYSVNELTMVPNVSLVGQDRFQAIINLEAGSNTDLLTGEMGNCTISNLTLSANMPGQTQNCSVYNGNVTSMLFDNVIFKNGFNVLSLDIDGLVQMSSVVVDGAQGNGVMIGGSRCSVDNIDFINTSALNNETLLTVSGANHVIQNVTCYTAIKNGVTVNGNNNVVKGVILNAITPVTNTGTNNRIEIVTTNNNIEIQNGTSKTVSGPYEISASSSTELIAGDKDITANNVEISATGNLNVHGATADVAATNGVTIAGTDIALNPTNPLRYKTPTPINNRLSYVPFKDANSVYQVLVGSNDLTNAMMYYPAENTDITTELNQLLTQRDVVIAPGTYIISSRILIPINRMLIGNNTILTTSSTYTDAYMVQIGANTPPAADSDATYQKSKTGMFGVNLNCNLKCSGILVMTRGAEIHYSKITLPIITGCGIDIFPYGVEPPISADCYVNYVEVVNNDKGNAEPNPATVFAYGIRTNGSDNYIYGFRTFGSKVGIWCSAYSGGTTITDSHVLCCSSADSAWTGSIGYDCSLSNSITLTDCYADNFNTGCILYLNSCITNFFYYCWETTSDTTRTAIKVLNTNNSICGLVSFSPKTIMLDVAKEYPFQSTNLISVGQFPYHDTFIPDDDMWKMILRNCYSYFVVPTTTTFVFGGINGYGALAPNIFNLHADKVNLTGFSIGTTEVKWGECDYNGAITTIYNKPGTNIRYVTLELPGYTITPNEAFIVSTPAPIAHLIMPREISNLSVAGWTNEGSHTYTVPATVTSVENEEVL